MFTNSWREKGKISTLDFENPYKCYFLIVFVQKSFLTKNYFLTAEINLSTQGPLYTCPVFPNIRYNFIGGEHVSI